MNPVDGVDVGQLLSVSAALKEIYPSAWRAWGEVLRSMDTADDDDIRQAFDNMATVFEVYLDGIGFDGDRKVRRALFRALQDACKADVSSI